MKHRVGIVGCGAIGMKRALNIGRGSVAGCVDIEMARAKKIADLTGASIFKTSEDLVSSNEVDIVIVSTLHDLLAPIALSAIRNGKHVLIEKPGGRNSSELDVILKAADEHKVKVRIGLNHRFHRAVLKANSLIKEEAIGKLMFIRGRYGHGGRVGYEKEWRANPKMSGGGELLDQGPHLIDLSMKMLGDFVTVNGRAFTYFWDMDVDDNAFLMMETKDAKTAFLHVSCTEWKNTFSMEIYGKKGKIELTGLGGSYGTERVALYSMSKEMGPPDTVIWEYPMQDNSWLVELDEFYKDIEQDRTPEPGVVQGIKILKIVEEIYNDSGYSFR